MVNDKFQQKVFTWAAECFGNQVVNNVEERRNRFLEEAIELFQAIYGTEEDAIRLIRQVYKKPVGEIEQEIGGVVITLSVLASVLDIDVATAGMKELDSVSGRITEIRAKNKLKQAAWATLKESAAINKYCDHPITLDYPDRQVCIRCGQVS